jgi:hypothetical protein
MLIYDGQSFLAQRNNNKGSSKLFNLPVKKLNFQSRNINLKNNFTNEKNMRKYSLYSTKEATPRKEYNPIPAHSSIIKNSCFNREKSEKIDIDDTLSQISQILNSSKKEAKFPINEEPNFVYDQILFNKSSIKKAKILSHKIGVLKLPISKISTKEALSNSDREKKCFSDRIQGIANESRSKNSKIEDNADVSCCFFRRK